VKIRSKPELRIRQFVNEYLEFGYRKDWNKISLSMADSYVHNRMVFEIAYWLSKNCVPFLTQPKFKTFYRPDFVVPTHVLPIIEVRASETEKASVAKRVRIPLELQDQIIFVDCYDKGRNIVEFKEKLIL